MATRISTTSTNNFTKIKKYLSNSETTTLINKMTKLLHFTKQQEPLALAA